MTALDIASAVAQHNPNFAMIARRLKAAGDIPSKSSNSKPERDTNSINTYMIVASLIASVTFAAMFQVPGGFDNDKESINFGAAKLACTSHFHWFLISDTAAFTSSIVMVVASSVDIYFGESALASVMCGLIMPFSVTWRIEAFVFATLITMQLSTYTLLSLDELESFLRNDCQYNRVAQNLSYLAVCPPTFSAIHFMTFILVRRRFLGRKNSLEKPVVFGYMLVMLFFNMFVGFFWA